MQSDINKYNQHKFEEQFRKTDLYQILRQDYDMLSFEYHMTAGTELSPGVSPRERLGSSTAVTYFSVVPFYYLKFLTDANPTNIYDLGCGWNIFKKYIPNIIGIDVLSENHVFHAGIRDVIDEDYIKNHQNYFESVFSINALHFIPLSNMRQRVLDFGSMIKDGGRGFLTLNYKRMLERENMENIPIEYYKISEEQVRHNLTALPFNLEVFEVDLSRLDNAMDGNIRMVISK